FYEKTTALFALAISQIFIINLNTLNIGHESEYNIIKIILEMNLRLFKKNDQTKQILIVLRDFNDQNDDFKVICDDLLQEIQDIWQNDIIKPQEFQNVDLKQHFKINFYKLAHYHYEIEKFNKQLFELRNQFVHQNNQNFLLKDYKQSSNLPIDALEELIKNLWETIRNNQDLNLPNAKIQAAQIRCIKIQEQSINFFSEKFIELKKKAEKNIVEDFGKQTNQIIQQSTEFYDEQTIYYQNEIKQDIKQRLYDDLMMKSKDAFISYMNKVQQELLKQNQKKNFCNTIQQLEKLINYTIQYFNNIIQCSIPFQQCLQLWEIQKIYELFKLQINNFFEQEKNICLTNYLNQKIENSKNELEKFITDQFYNLNYQFWDLINQYYSNLKNENQSLILQDLKSYFSNRKIADCIDDFDNKTDQNIKKIIYLKSKDLLYYIIQQQNFQIYIYNYIIIKKKNRFKKQFLYDNEGLSLNWKILDDEMIRVKYLNHRDKIMVLINDFGYYFIKLLNQNQSQITKEYEILLEKSQLKKIQDQFKEQSEDIYKDVLRKKVQKLKKKILQFKIKKKEYEFCIRNTQMDMDCFSLFYV
ncbi:hypothetical protein IMG5_102940, partial [Ichthyophthirius multifiliis]